MCYDIVTYNCQSLLQEWRLCELREELKNISWRVIGLAEVRRAGECCVQLENGDIFYHNGIEGGNWGTGFLVNSKRIDQKIIKFQSFSHRVSVLTIQIIKETVKIVQVYAPTKQAKDEEVEDFYTNVQLAVDGKKGVDTLYIIGDFNSRVGVNKGEKCIGDYGVGERNERGERLIEFADANNLKILNTFYKGDLETKWTWILPNGESVFEIDFMLAKSSRGVSRVQVVQEINITSDHRALGLELGASNKKSKRHFVKEKTKLRLNANELVALGFEDKLKMNLSEENCEELEDTIKCLNSNMKKAQEVAETNLGKNNSNKKKL